MGNILDNFHFSALHSTFEDIYTIPKEKFTIVQVADAPKFDMGAMHLGRHFRCFPGQGSFPVLEFMAAVRATGYDGYLSHEIFSDEFRSSQIDPVALDGKRSLIWLEGISNDEQLTNISNKNKTVNRIEFIEFSSNPSCQNELREMLENLGFTEKFRHKTKDVSVFSMEKVNIVINRQKGVCNENTQNTVGAIGFVVENKQKMKNWAKKLSYEWLESKAKDNELDIPAVRGFGGILNYFVEESQLENEFYEVEFIPTNNPKVENGITQIDHIGHSISSDFFQTNTLFYRAFLGLEIEDSLEILDPRGIVYSRVAKNTNNSIRIPLSSTKSQGTSTDQFIGKTGSGIQQIALHTNDIFKTAQSIKNKSLILPMPSNCYEDLRAKTQLSEENINKMQEFNILYDIQADGEFFHFYCKELNGLFMEIVQRKGTYNRYGEVNAQVRLAAQARDRQKL